jgi:hypothetical protein
MESKQLMVYIKWPLLFLFITVCSYLVYYTSQPHYRIGFDSIGRLLILSSIDPGIAIISLVTGAILTAIAYYEFKKRSANATIE